MFKYKKNFRIRESPNKFLSNSPINFSGKVLPTKPIDTGRFCLTPSTATTKSVTPVDQFSLSKTQASPIGFIGPRRREQICINGDIDISRNDQLESATNEYCQNFNNKLELESVELPKLKRVKLSLEQLKAQKEMKLAELKQQIQDKINVIKEDLVTIKNIKQKRFVVDSHMAVASKCQVEVRNQLNQIYNPGNELAKTAKNLIEEKRKIHERKFESLSFELDELIEGCNSAIQRKEKQLCHEIEIQERTLMTLEIRNKTNDQQMEIEKPKSESCLKDGSVSTNERSKDNSRSVRFEDDDDCVIIAESAMEDEEEEHNEKAPSLDGTKKMGESGSLEETENPDNHDSETTNPLEDEDEQQTDVEEDTTANDEERSFTPCQAQRLV